MPHQKTAPCVTGDMGAGTAMLATTSWPPRWRPLTPSIDEPPLLCLYGSLLIVWRMRKLCGYDFYLLEKYLLFCLLVSLRADGTRDLLESDLHC